MTKIDRPPWIDCVVRDCTVRTGGVISVTTAVVGIASSKYVKINAALTSRFV